VLENNVLLRIESNNSCTLVNAPQVIKKRTTNLLTFLKLKAKKLYVMRFSSSIF